MESKIYRGYRVTSAGVIYQKRFPEKEMKTQIAKTGYSIVTLCGFTIRTHRAVWEAFHGPVPSGMQLNHKDGDKLNNSLSNLELVTPKENMAHARANGLIVTTFEACAKAAKANRKIDDKQAAEMKRLWYQGISMRSIAKRFGCVHKTVSGVVNQTGELRARPDNRNKDWGLTK